MSDRRERQKRQWEGRNKNNLCAYCGINLREGRHIGCSMCLERKRLEQTKYSHSEKKYLYTKKIRQQAIQKYGGMCVCCGESDVLFLSIDHINDDGRLERSRREGAGAFYRELVRSPIRDDLQVLCFNCNVGRSHNRGICPHKDLNSRDFQSYTDNRTIPRYNVNTKFDWPDDIELLRECVATSFKAVAKRIGANPSVVRDRLIRRKLYDPVSRSYRISE